MVVSKYFVGLLFVVLGVLFLFNQAGIIEFDLMEAIKTYWPLIIILWALKVTFNGLRHYIKRRGSGTLIFGVIVLIFGVSLQGSKLGYFTFAEIWPWIWPFFFIFLGFMFLFRRKSPRFTVEVDSGLFSKKNSEKYKYSDETYYDFDSDSKGKIYRKTFIGNFDLGRNTWEVGNTDIWAGIGDIDLDFSKAILKDGVNTVDISGWIGDIKVYIPEEMPVKIVTDLKIGEVDIFHESSSGTNRSLQYISPNYDEADKKLKLHISLLIGDVGIKRV